jgi:protein phosphatase
VRRSGRLTQTLFLSPDALVLLIGIAGSGKSTFARRHFGPTEVVSSDAMRALVADDPADQKATDDAFSLLHDLVEMRLRRGRLTVVDATNVEGWARDQLVRMARRHRRPASGIVFDLPLELVLERNAGRPDRRCPPAAIRRQHRRLRDGLATLEAEGLSPVYRLTSPEEVDAVEIERAERSRGGMERPEGTNAVPAAEATDTGPDR